MFTSFMHMMFGASAPAAFPQGQPLPPNPYPQILNPEAHAAYDQCLRNQLDAGDDVNLLMHARCLGFLIIEAPSDKARDYLSSEITQCGGDVKKINNLAKFYIENLFRLFDPAPKDHRASKRAALERDNFRCMVTGCVDTEYYRNLSANDKIAIYPSQFELDHTNFCQIFPPSTNKGLEPEQPGHFKTSVWGIVLNYGGINVLDELNGSDCHQLYNGLTLTASLVPDFNYNRTPNIPIEFAPYFRIADLPLPDPRYLKLHAVVCRVGHLSGVATYLDRYDREQDERNYLAHDGSSAEYLTSRLHSILDA